MDANWNVYRAILRLHSPLHIGWGRISYLQRTRPYVTGRALRGALVSRMARNMHEIGEDPGDPYRAVSKTFAQYLTFTYFYPALEEGGSWQVMFPWENEAQFRRRFLSSYTATALEYPQQTAAENLLFETEYISPYTLDDGKPVYLLGYIFVNEDRLRTEKYDWKSALRRLQLGGERGYGWGEARLIAGGLSQLSEKEKLFEGIGFISTTRRPLLTLERDQVILAHTNSSTEHVSGELEPMVGREWRANQKNNDRRHIGQHLAFNGFFYAPGSVVSAKCQFEIGEGGFWQALPATCGVLS